MYSFSLIDLYNGSCLKFACCCPHLDEHPNICREVILLYIILNNSYSNDNDNKSSYIFDVYFCCCCYCGYLKIHR